MGVKLIDLPDNEKLQDIARVISQPDDDEPPAAAPTDDPPAPAPDDGQPMGDIRGKLRHLN